MPFRNITNEFLQVVRDQTSTTDMKRRNTIRPGVVYGVETVEKAFVAEARNILNHIHTLTKMLTSIRTAYLNIDTRNSSLRRQASRTIDLSEGSSLASIRHLTNEERDQIDLQARVILTRCSDRIKEMEALEKRRAELVASKMNPLARFLPARLRQDEASLSSEVIAAHHASITWYLSRRLTEASQAQKELQEERIRRQLERTRSLGSGAAQEVIAMRSQPQSRTPGSPSSLTGMYPGSWLGTTIGVAIGASYGPSQDSQDKTTTLTTTESWPVEEDEDDEIELSASQIMQFETENASILKNVQDTLESVQQAEERLRDISTLQIELVTRLTQQTELTDQLYEDALTATSTVEKGNEQLREAKRRAKDGRIFILVFLVGASFSLLFLHYY